MCGPEILRYLHDEGVIRSPNIFGEDAKHGRVDCMDLAWDLGYRPPTDTCGHYGRASHFCWQWLIDHGFTPNGWDMMQAVRNYDLLFIRQFRDHACVVDGTLLLATCAGRSDLQVNTVLRYNPNASCEIYTRHRHSAADVQFVVSQGRCAPSSGRTQSFEEHAQGTTVRDFLVHTKNWRQRHHLR
jgi:hypothetical protein